MKVAFEIWLQADGTPDQLETCLDAVMEELLRLDVEDPSVGGVLARGEVTLAFTVEAPSLVASLDQALATTRAALHGAGASTPSWPGLDVDAPRRIVVDPVGSSEGWLQAL